MRHIILTVGTLSVFALVSGCQTYNPFKSSSNSGSRSGLESSLAPGAGSELNGNWLPTDEAARGVYVAEFRDGVFVSRSPTTDKPLAKGKYSIVSDKKIDLEFIGAATNTAVKASCDRLTPDTMYCVPSVGSPFNLKRA